MTNGFTDALTLTELGLNWRMWKLEQAFIYVRPSGAEIVVPANFETDGASVPQVLWDLLPAWGTYSRAAVVHDYLCWLLYVNEPHKEAPTRKAADLVFWEAMGICGTNWFTKWVLYLGVRIGASAILPLGTNLVDIDNEKPSLPSHG